MLRLKFPLTGEVIVILEEEVWGVGVWDRVYVKFQSELQRDIGEVFASNRESSTY